MCNLYSQTRGQDALRALFAPDPGTPGPVEDRLGNLPPLPAIYPDQMAPVLRHDHGGRGAGRVLAMARWGLPTPPMYLEGKKTDRGVTNVRNTRSAHWQRWLGPSHRCLVPFSAFAEPRGAGLGNAWFRLRGDRPAFFAGLFVPDWTSVRKLKDGPTTDDLFGFLTCEANAEVRPVHPRAMPVILTEASEWEAWLTAPTPEALALQRPLKGGLLEPSDDPA